MGRGMTVYGFAALFALTLVVAGCGGGSSAPDVSGAPASDSATLFKASNLSKVLAQANGKLSGTPVTAVKIEPRDVKIVGKSKTVTVDNNGNSLVINTPSLSGLGTFSLSVVSPTTVGNLVGAVESKGKLKQSDIAYVAVALDPISNKPFYGVYPRSGVGHYQANIDGGNLKSIGTSGSTASTGGTAASGGTASAGASKAQSIANCIAKAGSDPQKIAACTSHGLEPAPMPLFRRSQDDPPPGSTGSAGAPADSDPVETALGHFSELSLPERAAELLQGVTESLDQDALAMDQLLAPWLPESDWAALSGEQRRNWLSLALILREAFQALVLARMVIRQEQTYKGATWVTYVNSPDGRAALDRGDVAAVVARRLPD